MERRRKAFIVYVDLDPVPGTFHTQDSAKIHLNRILSEIIPHYNPIVSFAPEAMQSIAPLITECNQETRTHGPDCNCF